jgi:hypothetical protein
MSIRFPAGLAAVSACALISAAAEPGVVEFRETRPLGKLPARIEQLYHLPVTFEEAPYDENHELFSEVCKNGHLFRYPAWKPIRFDISQPASEATQPSDVQAQPPPTAAGVTQSAVTEYNASGIPADSTSFVTAITSTSSQPEG